MNENKYLSLRKHYKELAEKILIATIVFIVLVIALMMINIFCNKIFYDLQLFFLFLSLIALSISIGLYLQYRNLLTDPLSELSANSIIYSGKTFVQRIELNRKIVYNNNAFFWTGLISFLIACIIWLFPTNKNPACKNTLPIGNNNSISDSTLYTLALQYANTPSEEKVCKTLVAINNKTIETLEPQMIEKKTYIKVYAINSKDYYTNSTDSNKFYNTQNHKIRVFTKKDFFDRYKFYYNEDSVYRAKQLLGLPPGQNLKYAVSFYVCPKDIFRPCLDEEISDCECALKKLKLSNSGHRKFIVNWHNEAYNNADMNKNYPFTQLGYTFDWNPFNFSHVGVSEFIIDEYKKVKLDTVMNIQDFLRQGIKGYNSKE